MSTEYIDLIEKGPEAEALSLPYYCIYVFRNRAVISIDFTDYECTPNSLLFLSPYQLVQWKEVTEKVEGLTFHGDFYCIEYHKREVACNGLLFNNIYESPLVRIEENVFEEILRVMSQIALLQKQKDSLNYPILRTYLQLILALASKEKLRDQEEWRIVSSKEEGSVLGFRDLVDTYFIQHRTVGFYAEKHFLSVDAFSKKVKKIFGKTPSKIIQERLVLEAKKVLHLSYKSIKEIASELNFEDEFYFSRYFKKEVGLSPKKFRDEVGISVVAKGISNL